MRWSRTVLLSCFFLSGAAALIYEVVWQRMLTLVFGVSTWSVTAVLTAFMAGLALGSVLGGLLADRVRHPIRVYALLELGIAIAALLVAQVIDPLMDVYTVLARSVEAGPFGGLLIRFALAFVTYLLPSTLIGATMPMMGRIVRLVGVPLGVGFGRFYAVNTAGAIVGAAAAGFLLIRTIGMHDATYVAMAGNLLAAAAALTLTRGRVELDPSPPPAPILPDPTTAQSGRPTMAPALIMVLAGLSGVITLGCEVAWARLLGVYTLNSVYVFTMLLTVFLAGLAGGSGLAAVCMRHFPGRLVTILVWTQIAAAFTGPLVLRFTRVAGDWSEELQYPFPARVFGLQYLMTAVMVFTPTLLMGFALPLLVGLLPRGETRPGRAVGTVYACNAVGTLLGAPLAGLVLIPLIGIRLAVLLLALGSFVLGGLAHYGLGTGGLRGGRLIPVVAVILIAMTLWTPAGMRFIAAPAIFEDEVLYYREGNSAVVHVTHSNRPGEPYRALYVDSQSVAGTSEALVTDQKMLAHLPLLLHPRPQRALTVGFGTGGTSYSMTLHGVETHCVEIERAVPAAARFFQDQNHGVVGWVEGGAPAGRGFRLILDDARSWLYLAAAPYDVIVDDLTSVQYRGNGNLYTVECFRLMKRNLTDDGIGCAWVPLNGIDTESLRIVVRSFREVFPHTSVWYFANVLNTFVVLVGTPDSLQIDLGDWRIRMADPDIRRDLATIGLDDPVKLASCVLLNGAEAADFAGSGLRHTDDRPILDYATHASVFRSTVAINLRAMVAHQTTPRASWLAPTTTIAENLREWRNWQAATAYLVEGHTLARERQTAEALAAYRRAAALVPDDRHLVRLVGFDE